MGTSGNISALPAIFAEFCSAFPVENRWFHESYWPGNSARVRWMIEQISTRHEPAAGPILDIGCGLGFSSYALARLGYDVVAVDMWLHETRTTLFERAGVRFVESNLNASVPLSEIANTGAFQAVLQGEVIEHILNCPLELMKRCAALSATGATLVLTTPNPSTLMNALRVLIDRHSLWGTPEFIREPKLGDGRVISEADIHYREYRKSELLTMISDAGFRVIEHLYRPMGAAPAESWFKRSLKHSGIYNLVGRMRLFGFSHYVTARRI